MAAAKPAFERDPVKLDPKHYKVEMENDQVRVVRIKYRGREKSVMHQTSARHRRFLDRRPL